MHKFSYGAANRGSSIRIPKQTDIEGNGYMEDRRPAANIDPYAVSASLISFSCLGGEGLEELEKHYNQYLANKK
jgi:glutamine synthetase